MKQLSIPALLIACGLLTAAKSVHSSKKDRAEAQVPGKAGEVVARATDAVINRTGKTFGSLFFNKMTSKNEVTVKDDPANHSPVSMQNAVRIQPGGSLIFEDHFEKDAMGDFPAKWNTNGSGKIVSIDGVEGKWLSVAHNSVVNPVLDKALPENCSIEFDLFLQVQGEMRTPFIQFGLTAVRDVLKEDVYYKNKFFVNLNRYNEQNGQTVEYGLQNTVIGSKSDFGINAYANKVLHVEMEINKTRIRILLAGEKIIDLPRALTPDMRNNFFINNNYVVPASETDVLVSNVKISSAATDARSLLVKQLMEDGKTSTTDILFDVNSDVIKKESYAVISQFGEAMVNNPDLKIKITGHTDSDGADAANLELSKKRAAAVKMYITENYAVAGSRIQTDGKGETQPVASNTTAAGKAKNRRVEFIKL